MTTNVFLIFLQLKAQEIWAFLKSHKVDIVMLIVMLYFLGLFSSMWIATESNISNIWILFVANYILGLHALVFLCLFVLWPVGYLLYCFGNFLRNNWKKAKQISLERKKTQGN